MMRQFNTVRIRNLSKVYYGAKACQMLASTTAMILDLKEKLVTIAAMAWA